MTKFKIGDRVVAKAGKTNLLMTFGVYDGVTYIVNKIIVDDVFTPNIDFICLDGIFACLNANFFVHLSEKTSFTLDAVDD
jgi:hypothetical protein